MARYAHLPIYNAAFSILKELYLRVPKFAKNYKYTLGSRLLDAGQEIILLIIQANNDRIGRADVLESLRRKIEELTILTRMGNELEQWGGERIYLMLSEKIVGLSRQGEGWRKSAL